MATETTNDEGQVELGRRRPNPVWVVALLTLALAIACVTYCSQLWERLDAQRRTLDAMAASLRRQAKTEKRALKELRAVSERQTAVMYAALGKVIPVKMPAEFDAQLSDAERSATRLARHERPDPSRVKRVIASVAKLARGLPPWADEDYLPRLNALRWALGTEYLLASLRHKSGETAGQLFDSAQNLRVQADSMPSPAKLGLSAATLRTLAEHLSVERRDLDSRGNARVYDGAKRDALACLAGGKMSPSKALDGLRPWLNSRRHGAEAKILAQKIRPLVAERQAGEIMKELDRARPHLSGSLLVVAVGGAYNRLAGLEISLASDGLASDPIVDAGMSRCKKMLAEIAARQSSKRAEVLRAYQAWAMRQIDACEARYLADKKVGWYNWQYKDIMHAAINHLLPIQQGALTVAVQQQYDEEFGKIWKKLTGREDQTQIAREEAIVHEMSPLEVWRKEHGK